MNFKNLGANLCIKFLLPKLGAILKSLISKLAKNVYEKLYNRFKSALESFEKALNKLFETDDVQKLEKRLTCCSLGIWFFEKIYDILDEILPEYQAAIRKAKDKYYEMSEKEFKAPVFAEGE
jgi:hexokinase